MESVQVSLITRMTTDKVLVAEQLVEWLLHSHEMVNHTVEIKTLCKIAFSGQIDLNHQINTALI